MNSKTKEILTFSTRLSGDCAKKMYEIYKNTDYG